MAWLMRCWFSTRAKRTWFSPVGPKPMPCRETRSSWLSSASPTEHLAMCSRQPRSCASWGRRAQHIENPRSAPMSYRGCVPTPQITTQWSTTILSEWVRRCTAFGMISNDDAGRVAVHGCRARTGRVRRMETSGRANPQSCTGPSATGGTGRQSFHRELLDHLGRTGQPFEVAPGKRGLVMNVFTIRDFQVPIQGDQRTGSLFGRARPASRCARQLPDGLSLPLRTQVRYMSRSGAPESESGERRQVDSSDKMVWRSRRTARGGRRSTLGPLGRTGGESVVGMHRPQRSWMTIWTRCRSGRPRPQDANGQKIPRIYAIGVIAKFL